MRNLADIESKLGVELPEAYVGALEDFGLPDIDDWQFYSLDELRWFEDHALAKTVPYEQRALVIGENAGGNVLVLLYFTVAGKPALSDEVYVIDHEIGEPEEVALDMYELLEQAGVIAAPSNQPLFETAFEISATRRKTIAAVNEALSARGYGAPPAEWDHGGDYLYLAAIGDGPVVLWARGNALWLGRRLAVLLGRKVRGFEVVLRDELVTEDDDDDGFPVTTRAVDIGADGVMADRETGFDSDRANHGSPSETAVAVLWQLVGSTPSDVPESLEFYKPAPPKNLSPRLVALIAAIGESDAVDLTEIAGQQAVRIELPDGTRQMSVLSDDELTTLREHVDL